MRAIHGRVFLIFVCVAALTLGCATSREVQNKKARAKANLGSSLIEQGKTGSGIKHLLDAVKMAPEDPDIHHELAIGFRNMGEYQRSHVHFTKALTLRPSFPKAWNNLGTLYLIEQRWDQAIECFQKAVSIVTYRTPEFAYNNMGLAYYGKKEYDQAVKSYRRAIHLSPTYSVCLTNLGRAYEAMNRVEQAIEGYRKAIYNNPDYPPAHFHLGRVYLKREMIDEAKEEFKETIALDPHGVYGDEASRLLRSID